MIHICRQASVQGC